MMRHSIVHTAGVRTGSPAFLMIASSCASRWRLTPLAEQLVRVPCFGQPKSLPNEQLDLLLLKEVDEGYHILSKPCPF